MPGLICCLCLLRNSKKFVQRVASSVEENITLIPDDLMLDEVVITQRLPQFRLDNGGLTTKVENTMS